MNGGYDSGYRACPCFWGTVPAELVTTLADRLRCKSGARVLDVGCGDGKNARHLAGQGIEVQAFDISEQAIANARALSIDSQNIHWAVADVRHFHFAPHAYEAVVASGSLHCLSHEAEVRLVISSMKEATKRGGYNVVQVFNARSQDLNGHDAGFDPILLPHEYFIEAYADWSLVAAVDDDILDRHPHTNVDHHHSVTRILARKPS